MWKEGILQLLNRVYVAGPYIVLGSNSISERLGLSNSSTTLLPRRPAKPRVHASSAKKCEEYLESLNRVSNVFHLTEYMLMSKLQTDPGKGRTNSYKPSWSSASSCKSRRKVWCVASITDLHKVRLLCQNNSLTESLLLLGKSNTSKDLSVHKWPECARALDHERPESRIRHRIKDYA